MIKAYVADKIFTGSAWLQNVAVLVDSDNIIKDIIPVSKVPNGMELKFFSGCTIAPAFIDLQIYGAYEKLLAVYPEADSIEKIVAYCKSGGAKFCLPTVATNERKVFIQCIDAVKKYWQAGGEGVLGLHIEGPWISKEKRGAHIESLIHPPQAEEVKELLDHGRDVIKMITLAPEVCNKEIIDLIFSYNVIISAGHSNATFAEAIKGFDSGIETATHLYNAMIGLNHREPGLVGAIFEHPSVMASIIADGHHVDWPAIRIAKKIMGERLFAITDAVTETHEGYYRHSLSDNKYEAGGILSGSALTMTKALKNLVDYAGIDLGEALRMCSLYPARVMKMENELGRIEKEVKSNMVVLNENLDVVGVI